MRKLVPVLGALALMIALLLAPTSGWAKEYVVKKGDCLSRIGHNLKKPWREIAKANNIKSPWVIYPGQKLVIAEPAGQPKAKPVVKAEPTVQPKVAPAQGRPKALPKPNPTQIATVLPLKAKVISRGEPDTLGDRIDMTGKYRRRGHLTGTTHKRVDSYYLDLAAYPIKTGDYYFGPGYTFLKTEGVTHKGYAFSTSADHFLGPRFKWFPKGKGHELGLVFGFGLGENSNWLLGGYYTNTQRKNKEKKAFSETTLYATGISASSNTLTLGAKVFLWDAKDFRFLAEAQFQPLDYRFASFEVGITDRQNVISFGAGFHLNASGLSWQVGPTPHMDNIFNNVELEPMAKRVEVTQKGLAPKKPVEVLVASVSTNIVNYNNNEAPLQDWEH